MNRINRQIESNTDAHDTLLCVKQMSPISALRASEKRFFPQIEFKVTTRQGKRRSAMKF